LAREENEALPAMASIRLDVSLREILAFEQQRRAARFRAGV
jgi:hypothetical protein